MQATQELPNSLNTTNGTIVRTSNGAEDEYITSKGLVKTEAGDHMGRFASKRNTVRQTTASVGAPRPPQVGRRASTIEQPQMLEVIQIKEPQLEEDSAENKFWDATDTHHMLPVFASARAYVPSSFESLLVQSFFGVLTPLICEKLVCGQAGQTVLQTEVPACMRGRRFLDLFRFMCSHHVRTLNINEIHLIGRFYLCNSFTHYPLIPSLFFLSRR
jgi:hypothetical protein